jgi:hypothetical protein
MKPFVSLLLLLTAPLAFAGPRTSVSYNVLTDSADAGGLRATSANYTHDASAGDIAGPSTLAPAGIAKSGYIAQLYEITALELAAPALTVNESETLQLVAALMLDDTTRLVLAPDSVVWSVQSGPLASIGASGIATAGMTFQNTDAIARGDALGFTGTLTLGVLNVTEDDFGAYAGDGLDDAWQVQFFGEDNPFAAPALDPDGDGHANLFEFTAGLVPTDSLSRFEIDIASNVDGQMRIVFGPLVAGRDYVVEFRTSLAEGDWAPLNGIVSDDDGVRTVIDPAPVQGEKFYRIGITRP